MGKESLNNLIEDAPDVSTEKSDVDDFSFTISRVSDSVVVQHSRELAPIDVIEILANVFLLVPSEAREEVYQIVNTTISKVENPSLLNVVH